MDSASPTMGTRVDIDAGAKPYLPPHHSALLNVEQVCAYLGGISPSKVWALVSAGKIPAPKKIDRLSRWRRSDLDDWIASLV